MAIGLVFLLLSFIFIGDAHASFIQVRPSHSLWVEYHKPQAGRDTVVLINGLTYSTRQYDAVVKPLVGRGLGVVRIDLDGMGQTLLRYAPSLIPYPWNQQVKDIHAVLLALGVPAPFNIVGLSYGGGIGVGYAVLFPEEIKRLILIAPYTEPLKSQDSWILEQIWATRQMFPFNSASDDELYDFFLHGIIYATYPQAEPIVLENPFKLEAIYNLVRGMRKFRPINQTKSLPAHSVHLMVAAADQYIPKEVLAAYWDKVPASAKMSRILVNETEHKMPEAIPEFTAAWIWQILKGNPILSGGSDFEGWPTKMTVRASNGKEFILND